MTKHYYIVEKQSDGSLEPIPHHCNSVAEADQYAKTSKIIDYEIVAEKVDGELIDWLNQLDELRKSKK